MPEIPPVIVTDHCNVVTSKDFGNDPGLSPGYHDLFHKRTMTMLGIWSVYHYTIVVVNTMRSTRKQTVAPTSFKGSSVPPEGLGQHIAHEDVHKSVEPGA